MIRRSGSCAVKKILVSMQMAWQDTMNVNCSVAQIVPISYISIS